jgi:hypothetical protein
MNRAHERHIALVQNHPQYRQSADYHPVEVGSLTDIEVVVEWLLAKDLKRANQDEGPNDWLYPLERLFLIKDHRVAVEFKLTFA